ncbi:Pentatricopeptide repeat-containing protein At4g21190 [Linum perenne]
MLSLRYCVPLIPTRVQSIRAPKSLKSFIVCEQKGPRQRYPRVWKSKTRIGTISKAAKLVDCVKGLSNVKEEVYGALDSFVAWDLEFPLITVKKALRTLQYEQEWKRIIQVAKWMLNKGQGRTMGTYFTLLNALAEDQRLDEAEELWNKLFMKYLEGMPRKFFDKMMSIYYKRDMHDKMFEIFADMEELGVQPSASIVNMVGKVFQHRGMLDKYEKLKSKYPPPKWEFKYIKGKRVKIRAKQYREYDGEWRSDGEGEGYTSSDEMDERRGTYKNDDDDDDDDADQQDENNDQDDLEDQAPAMVSNDLGKRDTYSYSPDEDVSRNDEVGLVSYQQSEEVDANRGQ